ncbi:hypothetical protein CTI12_AA105140 [Artemisia annua]|uniref:Uncharacterized protein n=1 Tax=Artemisia annua TaxID=35608 RepID=A0A2U1NZW0_ARTAN|nr:hypothetical protein CTI12_AA105140 [Artemisia annua]
MATFAALICFVVAAAIVAPPMATTSVIPLGSIGKWINSLLKNYENAIKGQKEIISSMQVGFFVAIRDLDTIQGCRPIVVVVMLDELGLLSYKELLSRHRLNKASSPLVWYRPLQFGNKGDSSHPKRFDYVMPQFSDKS